MVQIQSDFFALVPTTDPTKAQLWIPKDRTKGDDVGKVFEYNPQEQQIDNELLQTLAVGTMLSADGKLSLL